MNLETRRLLSYFENYQVDEFHKKCLPPDFTLASYMAYLKSINTTFVQASTINHFFVFWGAYNTEVLI